MPMRYAISTLLAAGLIAAGVVWSQSPAGPHVEADSDIEAGRYLVVVSGCNDCHTAGHMESGGQIPEAEWLTGSAVGWRGPWGTTYPSNLRLVVQAVPEDAWVAMLRTRVSRPPMPWMNVNQLSERDARAIYRYIVSLGPSGEPAPVAVPPEREPMTAYIWMVPTQPTWSLSQLAEPGT